MQSSRRGAGSIHGRLAGIAVLVSVAAIGLDLASTIGWYVLSRR